MTLNLGLLQVDTVLVAGHAVRPVLMIQDMGLLLRIIGLVVVIWAWIRFGVLMGILAFAVVTVVLLFVGPRIDRRFVPQSETFLEFHEAWDSIVGPPEEVDALSAKRLYLSRWRGERKQTGESAEEWLVRIRTEVRSGSGSDDDLIDPDGDQTPDPVQVGLMNQMMNNLQVAEQVGADWPDRDSNGSPVITARVDFYDEESRRWSSGTLEAKILAGGLTPQPVFKVLIYEGDDVRFVSESATWLVDRLDLDFRVPAHELRGMYYDLDQKTSVARRIVFVMRDSGFSLIDGYLAAYGPDPSKWLEYEPSDWVRITPPDPDVH